MAKGVKIKDWEKLPDEDVLQMRIRDLGVQIAGSELQPLIERLYLVNTLIARCDALGLYTKPNQVDDIIGITVFLASVASNTPKIVGRRTR